MYLYANKPKRTLKLKLGSTFYIATEKRERFHMQSIDQFVNYFLPTKYNYQLVGKDEKSDITIWDIYLKDNAELRKDEINILICVENVDHWNWYAHYTKYGNYGDDKMNIYLYNHIDKLSKQNHLAIPTAHLYMNYFITNNLQPSYYTKFANKRFCLLINKSKLNPDIQQIKEELEKIDIVDDISMYTNIANASCYHSMELLNVFNQYKFIICYENSYKNGYITEKIFNCFFARTLPIYKGAPNVLDYFEAGSFLDGRNPNLLQQIQLLNNNEELYDRYIHAEKVSKRYNNEQYNEHMVNYIENRLWRNMLF